MGHQHRQAADPGHQVVVRFGDLRLEPEKDPGALEDMLLLGIEQFAAGVYVRVYTEHALGEAVIDKRCEILAIHGVHDARLRQTDQRPRDAVGASSDCARISTGVPAATRS